MRKQVSKRGSQVRSRGRVRGADLLEHRICALKKSGTVLWSGRRLGAIKPEVRARGKGTVGDLVVENRE